MKKKAPIHILICFYFWNISWKLLLWPFGDKINSAFDFLFMNRAWFQISLNIHMELFTPNR